MLPFAVVAGALVGLAYTLSPLTVAVAPLFAAIVWYAARDLPRGEQRWVVALLAGSIAIRLAAIAGLFLVTDHTRVVAGIFFGDEAYYIKRSMLLTSLALRAPISPEDITDAFEEIGDLGYMRLLTFLQVLFGPSPYGLRVLNVACAIFGAVLLYRLARRSFGGLPAIVGLSIVLCLPSLFAWSVSLLKEPMLMVATGLVLVSAVAIVRGDWSAKAAAVVVAALAAVAAEALRLTGSLMAIGGVVLGYVWQFATTKPARAVAMVVAIPCLALGVLTVPPLHDRAMDNIKIAAARNRGHVFTAGFSYKLLDERFYGDSPIIETMTNIEAARFIVRAVVHFVIEPTPENVRSRIALAYLPEQLLWFAMLVVLPLGIRTAIRVDRLLTMLLLGSAALATFLIAISGGNVGTLVRHRGTVIVYLAWLSAIGFCDVAARLLARGRPPLPDRSMMRTSLDAIR